MPNLPELPRVTLDVHYVPPTGKIIGPIATDAGLQTALAAAVPGDCIALQSGSTFAPVVLPAKAASASGGSPWIVIRSSDPASLCAEGGRIDASYAPKMARIVTVDQSSALSTAQSASFWRIMGVEICMSPKNLGCYAVVALDTTGNASTMPHDVILDRCYIHANALGSARRGVQLGGARNAIVGCRIEGFYSMYGKGTESCGILAYNGPGPYHIENNFIEGCTQGMMIGGAVDTVMGPVIPSDITIRRNLFTKNLRWMSAVIPAPVVTAKNFGVVGAGSQVYYQVVAHGNTGSDYGVIPVSSAFIEIASPLMSQGATNLSWPAVTYGDATDPRTASSYTVYRTTDPPTVGTPRTLQVFEVGTALNFTDSGQAPSSTMVDSNGQYPPFRKDGDLPLEKNGLEMKCAQRVLLDSNIIENGWYNSQPGTGLMLSPRDPAAAGQGPVDFPNAIVSDITAQNNIIRHTGAAFAVASFDDHVASGGAISARVLLRNNLAWDIDAVRWGDGTHAYGAVTYRTVDLTADHNTIIAAGQFSCARLQQIAPGTRETWTGNILAGDLSTADPQLGGPAGFFDARAGTGQTFSNNALVKNQPYLDLAGWKTAAPDTVTIDGLANAGFTDYVNGNFSLTPSSPLAGRGVDWAALMAATAGVEGGAPAQTSPTTAPTSPTTTPASPATAPTSPSTATPATGLSGAQAQALAGALSAISDELKVIVGLLVPTQK